jgi:hypothetical protein
MPGAGTNLGLSYYTMGEVMKLAGFTHSQVYEGVSVSGCENPRNSGRQKTRLPEQKSDRRKSWCLPRNRLQTYCIQNQEIVWRERELT